MECVVEGERGHTFLLDKPNASDGQNTIPSRTTTGHV